MLACTAPGSEIILERVRNADATLRAPAQGLRCLHDSGVRSAAQWQPVSYLAGVVNGLNAVWRARCPYLAVQDVCRRAALAVDGVVDGAIDLEHACAKGGSWSQDGAGSNGLRLKCSAWIMIEPLNPHVRGDMDEVAMWLEVCGAASWSECGIRKSSRRSNCLYLSSYSSEVG